ncbi:MAG: type II secretion system protein [Bacilli bacterium]|nr:type II secretion system protein [Bacilli bacterium]
MRDTKGFTLVELLAVIVILAVVALITTPLILNVINDARKKGAEDKAWGTIDAVKLAYTEAQYGSTAPALTSSGITVTFTKSGTTLSNDSETRLGKAVKVSGDIPESGTVTIAENGTITCSNLKFSNQGTFCCSTTDGMTMSCGSCES